MKQFIKFVFASAVGVIIALILLALIGFWSINAAGKKEESLKEESVFLLNLDEFIPELTGNISEQNFLSSSDNMGLFDLRNVIKSASSDPNIKGMLIKTKYVSTGQSSLVSIREELKRFKESGKFVWAYHDYYAQSGYWLATVADSLFLNPNGFVDLKGYGTTLRFYKDFMDKVGIDMNIFYAGKFKSATEPYRRNTISEANRTQINEFLQEMKQVMVADISEGRMLPTDKIEYAIDHYTGGTARSALTSGLVDGLVYWEDVEQKLKNKLGIEKDLKFVSHNNYKDFTDPLTDFSAKNKIAVVVAEGLIMYGDKGKGVISDDIYQKIFKKISKKDDVKAVVLRINSPGGNSIDSDNLNHAVVQLRKKGIPVVASFGDYAASGGYYIGCNADTIVASPNSLTGSIGVYVMFPNFQELLHEKLGITHDTVKTDPFAVSYTSILDLTEMEKKHIQDYTDELYIQFLERVAKGRGLTVAEVDEIAQGRVWTGKKAQKIGLVDELGDLERAIEIAAEMAGIQEYGLLYYPQIKINPFKKALEPLLPEEPPISLSLSPLEKELLGLLSEIKAMTSEKNPMALLPYSFHWN